jgi:hypothetical protein
MRASMNMENVDIPPNHDLSDIDKAYMAINYPRDLSSVWEALQIIDLDSNTKSAIVKAHEAQDVLEMRRLLADFSSSFPDCRPFSWTPNPVIESTTPLAEVVVASVTDIVQNIPNSPSPPLPLSRSSTLAATGSIFSFCSQTTVSTCVGRIMRLWEILRQGAA